MPKKGTIYFSDPPLVEGGDWETTFLGAVMTLKKAPEGPRYVLSLDKRGESEGEGGKPVYHKATAIEWSDGSKTVIADKTIILKLLEQKPNPKHYSDGGDDIPF